MRADNLIADPSFEIVKNRDQFGRVFAKWEGWNYEGDCSFEVGEVPHTGKTSALLVCSSPARSASPRRRTWNRAATGSRPTFAGWISARAHGT